MNRVGLLLAIVVLIGLLSTAVANPPGNGEDPCSAPFWHEYTDDGKVAELKIEVKAATTVVPKDNYFLKLLNIDGKSLGYAKLVCKKNENSTIIYDFEKPIRADAIRKVELFSPRKDVKMLWMKVSGKIGKNKYVFFDHECPGMVIGPSGCIRMKIH